MNRFLSLAPLAFVICSAACGARPAAPTLPVETQNQVLSHYLEGESLATIASEFGLSDPNQARHVVHDRMIVLARRFYRDHR